MMVITYEDTQEPVWHWSQGEGSEERATSPSTRRGKPVDLRRMGRLGEREPRVVLDLEFPHPSALMTPTEAQSWARLSRVVALKHARRSWLELLVGASVGGAAIGCAVSQVVVLMGDGEAVGLTSGWAAALAAVSLIAIGVCVRVVRQRLRRRKVGRPTWEGRAWEYSQRAVELEHQARTARPGVATE
jgi:hypothetical protein